MTGLLGIRVMRGPHWDQGDIDGGEGHLGTVTNTLDNGQVQVLWDKGQESTCYAGVDEKFDLRVFDSAQAGVRHPDTKCAECGENHIYGTLWRCKDCSFGDLCPLCYGDDKHDLRHCFLRLDHYKSDGVPVKKRKVSTRMRSMGIFPGAKVVRGRDWMWSDQDGGVGSQGEAQAFENVAPDSSRNLMRVQWQNGKSNSYRLGHRGTVDLKCVEEEVGPYYYRDHLPLLDASKLPYPLASQAAFGSQSSTTSSAQTSSAVASSSSDTAPATTTTTTPPANSHTPPPPIPPRDRPQASDPTTLPFASQTPPQAFPSQDGAVGGRGIDSREVTEQQEEEVAVLAVGDEVMVGVNENTLRDCQEDYGGVSQKMIQRLGEKGIVTEVNTGVIVRFGSASYRLNPMVLVKVWPLKEGDVVRIRRDVSQVKLLNKHIAWNQQIADTCGSVGRVQAVHNDNSITATFGHYQTFRFASSCCVPAPTATPDPVGTLGQARKAAVANTEAAEPSPGQAYFAGGPVLGGDPTGMERMMSEVSQSLFKTKENQDRTGDGQDLGIDSNAGIQRELLRRMGLLDSDDNDDKTSDPQLKILFPMISQGNMSAVKTMVQANPSLLTKTEQSLTPLMYACYKGQRDVVTSLLDLGADVNGVGGRGRTPLYIAISREKENIAIMLLQRGANPNVKNDRQRTPLHAAAYDNLTRVARMLICMGADVNAKDMVQDTPLFDAIDKGHEEVAEVLLEANGLNPQALNIKGFNILQLACLQGKGRIVELILSCKNRPDVNALLTGEYSALHIAANNNHVECVGILVLLGGATVDIRDGRRLLTPLHLACKRRQMKAAEALLGLGAAVNARDVNNNTPLHLAMGKSLEGDNDDMDVSHTQAVEDRTSLACMLLTHGADADMRDDGGKSPLAYGRREVQVNVEQYLINVGVCAPEDQGATALPHPPATADAATSSDGTGLASKQDGTEHLNHLLQGVSIQCATCDAMSDVTLEPCGHKVVCRKCCDAVSQCPQCRQEVEDKEPDNTDEQEEKEEEDTKNQEEKQDEMKAKEEEEEEEEEKKEEEEKETEKETRDEDDKDSPKEGQEQEELNTFD